MKAKDLRNAVLQLAVQGKLVLQNPEDEPASVLLERIKAEKARLVKEKKIKKQKPLPVISEEEIPFEIPESWEWVRLGKIGLVQTGTTPPKTHPEYFNGDIPFIKPADITTKGINYNNESLTKLGITKGRLIEQNSVMMVCIGGSIGKAYFTEQITSCNQQINAITPFSSISTKLVFSFMSTFFFLESVKRNATGTATPIINKNLWSNLVIPLPPLEEQKRIVSKLEEIMPLIDEYDKLEQKLSKLEEDFPEKLKKSILQYAVQGKLIPQSPTDEPASILLEKIKTEKAQLIKDKKIKKQKPLPPITEEEKPFEIPESWEWVRLGETTYNFGQKKPENTFTYIDVGSINNKARTLGNKDNVVLFNDAPSRARKIVKEGSVLYSTVRPYLMNMCIINRGFEFEPIASTAFAVLNPYKSICNKYLYYYLQSNSLIKFVNAQMVGVAYPAISEKNLIKAVIPVPPINEQKRIVDIVKKMIDLCTVLSNDKNLKNIEVENDQSSDNNFEYFASRGTVQDNNLQVAEDEYSDYLFAARSTKQPVMSEKMKERMKIHIKRAKEAKKLKE